MSRYNPQHDMTNLLRAADTWKSQCLLHDGALLDDAGQYWNYENLMELDNRFIQNPQQGDGTYSDKLANQLADASQEAIKLMAELNWLLLLFSTNVTPIKKRELVRNIWELTNDEMPESWLLEDATLSGAGSTGTGYNAHRWRELAFLIEMMKAFKALAADDQRLRLVEEPWAFAEWIGGIPDANARQFRHIVCFLLFPDSFEHTSVGDDKKKILHRIGGVAETTLDTMSHREVDEQLFHLRSQLEEQEDGPVGFYLPPWVDQWRSSTPVWLMAWNPVNFVWSTFQDDRLRVARGENVTRRWSTASTQLKVGDIAYLMRLARNPKGLIACGTVASEPYEDDHYAPEKAKQGEKALYVDITLSDLRDPEADAYISLSDLKEKTADDQNWTPQGSGIKIKPDCATIVHGLWNALPPINPVQVNKKTPSQPAINIAKPMNMIFYGPPGTGKTHHWRAHLQSKYESRPSNVTTDKWLEEQMSNTSWWESIALALADNAEKRLGTRVDDLLDHPFFRAKARVQGRADSPNLRAQCWQALQIHTVPTSQTVNVALDTRQLPFIFDKQQDGSWILTGDWEDVGEGLRKLLETLQQGPQSQEVRIKRHLEVTFHQSYSYEDFVEGIRPLTTDGAISYEVRDGVFKAFCKKCRKDPKHRYALFIDEINRGNISRIFGELITLIEADKRAWWNEDNQLVEGMEIILPYSGDQFGVPKNLDIYATMNTADRSIALMDVALRRRFHFTELMPEPELIKGSQGNGDIPDGEGGFLSLRKLLNAINLRLRYLLHRDQTFGHAYFMKVTDIGRLRSVMINDIIPMLAEYFYDDWGQIRRILADENAPTEHQIITSTLLDPDQLFAETDVDLPVKPDFRVKRPSEITPDAFRKIYEPLGWPE